MSRDGIRRSPVPHLISDAELNEFPRGMGLRSRGVDAAGKSLITVWYVNPKTGIKTTTGGAATARKDIVANLRQAAELLKSKQSRAKQSNSATLLNEMTPVGAVARLWRQDAEQNGYWTRNGKRKPYRASTLRNKEEVPDHTWQARRTRTARWSGSHIALNRPVGSVTKDDIKEYFANDWTNSARPLRPLYPLLNKIFEFAERNGAIDPELDVGCPQLRRAGKGRQPELSAAERNPPVLRRHSQ